MTEQFKARPTVYKGVKMRSRLEAGFAAWLDESRFTWEYEPCAFATEDGQYLPDFRLTDVTISWSAEPATIYVEVKPDSFLRDDSLDGRPFEDWEQRYWEHLDLIGQQAQIVSESDPAAAFILAKPSGLSVLEWDDQVKCRWPFGLVPIDLPLGKYGFAHALKGPWSDDYWRPKTARRR